MINQEDEKTISDKLLKMSVAVVVPVAIIGVGFALLQNVLDNLTDEKKNR